MSVVLNFNAVIKYVFEVDHSTSTKLYKILLVKIRVPIFYCRIKFWVNIFLQ